MQKQPVRTSRTPDIHEPIWRFKSKGWNWFCTCGKTNAGRLRVWTGNAVTNKSAAEEVKEGEKKSENNNHCQLFEPLEQQFLKMKHEGIKVHWSQEEFSLSVHHPALLLHLRLLVFPLTTWFLFLPASTVVQLRTQWRSFIIALQIDMGSLSHWIRAGKLKS